jgi:hypothetical protein
VLYLLLPDNLTYIRVRKACIKLLLSDSYMLTSAAYKERRCEVAPPDSESIDVEELPPYSRNGIAMNWVSSLRLSFVRLEGSYPPLASPLLDPLSGRPSLGFSRSAAREGLSL